MKSKSGFSLIEILVVIALFSIIGIIVAQSTITAFRGAKRSDSDSRVRDNINFAAQTLERHLRNARTISCPSSTRVDFTDQNKNTGYFYLNGTGADAHIASYSASPSQTFRITATDVTVDSLQFNCVPQAGNTGASINISITASDRNTIGTDKARVQTSTRINVRSVF